MGLEGGSAFSLKAVLDSLQTVSTKKHPGTYVMLECYLKLSLLSVTAIKHAPTKCLGQHLSRQKAELRLIFSRPTELASTLTLQIRVEDCRGQACWIAGMLLLYIYGW